MKCWLFLCSIYVLAHYTDEHLVVLNQNEKSFEKGHPSKGHSEKHMGDSSGSSVASAETGSSEPAENNNGISGESAGSSEGSDYGTGDTNNKAHALSEHGFEKGSNEKNLMKIFDVENDNEKDKSRKLHNWMRWASEISSGNPLEIMGTNPETYQPDKYIDLNRRFVLQYPYSDNPQNQNIEYAPANKEIVPIEAPEELVSMVAKESAMRVAAQPHDPDEDVVRKKLLRSGDYWNGIWKEEGQSPKAALRNANDQALGVIKAKIMPGNEFYDVIAKMKEISPRLLYIINEKEDKDD